MADREGDGPVLAGRHVLLGVSGGIAAYKAVLLARLLVTAGAEVQVSARFSNGIVRGKIIH